MLNDIYAETKRKMNETTTHLKRELNTLRTGRATPSLLDGVRVDYYGTLTPLNQMASINTPEASLLVVQPWDASVLVEIEKAIQKSNLGLNPMNDGKLIRIPIPALTEDRRKELVKVARKMGEDAKVAIRNERRTSNEMIKELEKEKEVTEDDSHKGQAEIQRLTDGAIKELDEIIKKKEDDILSL